MMNIKERLILLKNRKKYLEITAKLVEELKLKSDLTRSIDNTIGYLKKRNIDIRYKVK